MMDVHEQLGISEGRWSGSLLYNEYQRLIRDHADVKRGALLVTTVSPSAVCTDQNVRLTPPSSSWRREEANPSELPWHPWMTRLIQQYYATGFIRVPDNGNSDAPSGIDVLMLLEYFGILYRAAQVQFASERIFHRIKIWSEYLATREVIAADIVKYVHQSLQSSRNDSDTVTTDGRIPMKKSIVTKDWYFVATPDQDDIPAGADGPNAPSLIRWDGSLLPPSSFDMYNTNPFLGAAPSGEVLDRFFGHTPNGSNETSDSEHTRYHDPAIMRNDFTWYLRDALHRELPGISRSVPLFSVDVAVCTLPVQRIKSQASPRRRLTVSRAVLHVRYDERENRLVSSRAESSNPNIATRKVPGNVNSKPPRHPAKTGRASSVAKAAENAEKWNRAVREMYEQSRAAANSNRKPPRSRPGSPSPMNAPQAFIDDVYRSIEANEPVGRHKSANTRHENKPVAEIGNTSGQFVEADDDSHSEDCTARLPFRSIRVDGDTRSVTSAITTPNALRDDWSTQPTKSSAAVKGFSGIFSSDRAGPSSRNQEAKAKALQHEWIQSTVLNRDIDARMRALLREQDGTEDISNQAPIVISNKTAHKRVQLPTETTPLPTRESGPRVLSDSDRKHEASTLFSNNLNNNSDSPWDWMLLACQGIAPLLLADQPNVTVDKRIAAQELSEGSSTSNSSKPKDNTNNSSLPGFGIRAGPTVVESKDEELDDFFAYRPRLAETSYKSQVRYVGLTASRKQLERTSDMGFEIRDKVETPLPSTGTASTVSPSMSMSSESGNVPGVQRRAANRGVMLLQRSWKARRSSSTQDAAAIHRDEEGHRSRMKSNLLKPMLACIDRRPELSEEEAYRVELARLQAIGANAGGPGLKQLFRRRKVECNSS
jgi:hypothetical protein